MEYKLVSIHPDAKIGKGVVIEPFTHIEGDVVIGDGSWIGSNVTIMNGARIGKNVKIFPGAVISAIPQDLKFAGEHTTAEIGDNSTIRECVTINRGTDDRGKTVIGENCLLMAYVHVAHDCIIGRECIVSNSTQIAGHVVIDNYVIVGGTSAIHQFVRIGSYCFISGGSLVRKDVPPYVKAIREPLTYGGLNFVGLKRRGFSLEKYNEIQEIYRYVFLKGLNTSQAVDQIVSDLKPSKERDEITGFITETERGIIKGYVAK